MKVHELISFLQTLDQDKRITIGGYEGGVNDVSGVYDVYLQIDKNEKWYYGKHEDVLPDEPHDEVGYLLR